MVKARLTYSHIVSFFPKGSRKTKTKPKRECITCPGHRVSENKGYRGAMKFPLRTQLIHYAE